jgi:hypothetical protein
MDFRQVFSDASVRAEFLEQFEELAANARTEGRGFESLEGGAALRLDPEAAVTDIVEGRFALGSDPGLEAIIERFTRPVYLVQGGTFTVPLDTFPEQRGDPRTPRGRPGTSRTLHPKRRAHRSAQWAAGLGWHRMDGRLRRGGDESSRRRGVLDAQQQCVDVQGQPRQTARRRLGRLASRVSAPGFAPPARRRGLPERRPPRTEGTGRRALERSPRLLVAHRREIDHLVRRGAASAT